MKLRAAIIIAGMAALFAVVLLLDAAELRRALRYSAGHPLGLLAAFGAYTGAFLLRAQSWRCLIREEVTILRLFSLILGALFLNHAAPAKAGDLARMYGVRQRGVPAGRAVASVVVVRLVDLLSLVAVLVTAWAFAGGGEWRTVAVSATVVALLALSVWTAAHFRVPVRTRRIAALLEELQAALRQTSPRALGLALACAAPAWVLEAGILIFVARGLGMEISFAGAVAATCFAVLLQAVPLTPGGLGTYEAGMVFALVAVGLSVETAFAAAVITHALKFLYAFAAAPFAIYEGISGLGVREQNPFPIKEASDEARLEV